ncbi:FIST N-terminal domain-containing protein [Xanthobacter sp. V4C-4]|uniref:FIST signal transduction protein n=1 Tax=Xanthobacter cornucopiae TaxID=3119924 RepID=UPI00372BF3BC
MKETDDSLRGIDGATFRFESGDATLVPAYVSPHVDVAAVTTRLKRLAQGRPVVAVSTAGELCGDGTAPLYRPTGSRWSSVTLQIFPPDLIGAVSVHSVPLHNADIRAGAPTLPREERVERIVQSLGLVHPVFRVDARDVFALAFIDGLSACENCFTDAVYRTGRFPCLFIGGSAGGTFDFRDTYIFNGESIVQNHAVVLFEKVAEGRRYGAFKTQNFKKTGRSFSVADADPDRRVVAGVIQPGNGDVTTFLEALASTFGIEIDGELFVRSLSGIDLHAGTASFFCDVNPGDELLLLEATDFTEQTRRDLQAFLKGKPKPLGAILNDCILRRLNNERALPAATGLWPCPSAGFSTFGELFGIHVNQTLSAVMFFDTRAGNYTDAFYHRPRSSTGAKWVRSSATRA